MFGFFLELVFRSIKLDKKLYREVKTFSEVSIYFAAIIMILDGVAGAIATNNFYKTSLSLSALTAILTWFFWAVLIFTIGAFSMRSAGCIINDLWDRDIDRKISRTRLRPIASGEISQKVAFGFLIILFQQ